MGKPATKKKRKPLSEKQKQERSLKIETRSTFKSFGFREVVELRDFDIEFQNEKTDIDGVFIKENLILLVEYTTDSDPVSHLKKKKTTYDKIVGDPEKFIQYLKASSGPFRSEVGNYYTDAQLIIKIIYRSYKETSKSLKLQVPSVQCVDRGHMSYFRVLSKSILGAAVYEWLEYLGVDFDDYMPTKPNHMSVSYKGALLPESHSNFKSGYKILSFYIDPLNILQRSYVLRKDGWKDTTGVYQRMIEKKKIELIRGYLATKRRVFVNNIIATLSPETKITDSKGNTIDFSEIKKTTQVNIHLPGKFNSVGIIDGQHRVFSYHEGGTKDASIAPLRTQQNLLVTGIVYPEDIDEAERARFEAELFLEINSNQTNAKTDRKQAIGVLLRPYSAESIARMVIEKINEDSGPLGEQFERASYDTGKLKTSSIVSFGLRPLVKLSGNNSLFFEWPEDDKGTLASKPTSLLRQAYVDFCFLKINEAFLAAKKLLPKERWTSDRAVENRFLTTTNINGILLLIRIMIENGEEISLSAFTSKFSKGLATFDFSAYHSSQYGRMARDLYATLK